MTLRILGAARRHMAVVASVVLTAVGMASASVARADTLSLTCTGTSSTTFSPGLTQAARSVTFSASETLGACVALGAPTLTGGTNSSSGTFTISCTDVAFAGDTATFNWNNSASSTVDFGTATVAYADQAIQITQTGTVTSGLDAGQTAVETITLASDALAACDTQQGLTSASGPIVLTIAP